MSKKSPLAKERRGVHLCKAWLEFAHPSLREPIERLRATAPDCHELRDLEVQAKQEFVWSCTNLLRHAEDFSRGPDGRRRECDIVLVGRDMVVPANAEPDEIDSRMLRSFGDDLVYHFRDNELVDAETGRCRFFNVRAWRRAAWEAEVAKRLGKSKRTQRSRYRDNDKRVARKAHALCQSRPGLSPWQAVGLLAGEIQGIGSEASKRKRVIRVYNELHER